MRKYFAYLAFTLLFLSNALMAQPPAPPPPAVFVQTVAAANIDDRVEALGTLRANETAKLAAAVTEVVTAVRFQDGQRVQQGAILVEMTSAEEQALLEEVQAEVEEAKNQLERVRILVEQNSASRSLLDQRQREYTTAKARVVALESRLRDRLIKAPFSGVLGLRNVSVGDLVTPGQTVAIIHDDQRMKLDFAVPEIYLAKLKSGIPIIATTPAFPEKSFTGEVLSVDNQIDPITRSIQVRAILPNPERELVPGLLMNVILLSNARNAILVPEQALLARGEQHFVYVIEQTDNQTIGVQRAIRIGQRQFGSVEVLDGITVGEQIIIQGQNKVKPGQPVRIAGVAQSIDASLPDLLSE